MPFLILRTGLAKGTSWSISETPLTIGRDRTCDIPVPDSLVSRRHCEVALGNGGIELRDLESSNATLVNGQPVRSCTLTPGDEITLGRTILAVADTDDTADSASLASQLRTTVSLSEGQAIYLADDPMGTAGEESTHRAAELVQLFRHSRAFSRAKDLDELASSLERTLLERFAPLHMWVAMVWGIGDDLDFSVKEVETGHGRQDFPDEAMRQALRELRGFLVPQRVSVDGRKSLQVTLVAPVHFAGHPVAVLALQSHSRHRIYDEGDLHFLVSVANAVAPFFGALEQRDRLRREVQRLRHARQKSLVLVGESPCMQEVRRTIEEVADTVHPVLIVGETGTGKEVAANLIHELSGRIDGPFVAVNCAAIPKDLFESELFGHEKGAFTGATGRQTGLMEQSDGGTLFLDEIGDLTPEHQAAILRALDTRSFRPVGGKAEVRSDFRVVAATNRDIHAEVEAGTFRRDLYHRLRGVEIAIDPLRLRREDIPALAEHFLAEARVHSTHPVTGFEPDTLDHLHAQDWPGNARELKYCIETAVTFCKKERITLTDVRAAVPHRAAGTRPPTMAEAEQKLIQEALDYCDGNVVEAAKLLGVGKDTIYRRLAKDKNRD
jgi:DNA-binding NtrC family response regulator